MCFGVVLEPLYVFGASDTILSVNRLKSQGSASSTCARVIFAGRKRNEGYHQFVEPLRASLALNLGRIAAYYI